MKRTILVLTAVLAIVVVAGGITGYFYYDHATQPDRSSPGVVVREYLDATFADASHPADAFTCGDPGQIVEIQQLVRTVDNLQDQYKVSVKVAWANFRTQTSGKSATVDVDLMVRVPEKNGSVSESREPWQFSLEDRSGWRVCNAHQTS